MLNMLKKLFIFVSIILILFVVNYLFNLPSEKKQFEFYVSEKFVDRISNLKTSQGVDMPSGCLYIAFEAKPSLMTEMITMFKLEKFENMGNKRIQTDKELFLPLRDFVKERLFQPFDWYIPPPYNGTNEYSFYFYYSTIEDMKYPKYFITNLEMTKYIVIVLNPI